MTDLVLRDLSPDLAGRIRKLAELQGRSVHEVMAEVLRRMDADDSAMLSFPLY